MDSRPVLLQCVIRLVMLCLLIAIPIGWMLGQDMHANTLTLGEHAMNFLVISDWGREGIDDTSKKTPGQLKVAKQFGVTAGEIGASFVVSCGDNFHGNGVASISDPLWQVNFEGVYDAPSLMVPWYIALGNHDYEGNVEAELAYGRIQTRWTQPARFFSFTKALADSSELLCVILDSSPFVQDYRDDPGDEHHVREIPLTTQVRWLDSVLSASSARWKLAFFHHPAYSASMKHGSTKEIQMAIVPILEKYGVCACFSGHDHDLQHSHPNGSTIEYFGVGGGSEPRPAGHADFTRFSVSSLGFAVVSILPDQIRITFVNEKGAPLYSYEIHH